MSHTLKTVADLEAVYGAPNPRSLLKEIDHRLKGKPAQGIATPSISHSTGPIGAEARTPAPRPGATMNPSNIPTRSPTPLAQSYGSGSMGIGE